MVGQHQRGIAAVRYRDICRVIHCVRKDLIIRGKVFLAERRHHLLDGKSALRLPARRHGIVIICARNHCLRADRLALAVYMDLFCQNGDQLFPFLWHTALCHHRSLGSCLIDRLPRNRCPLKKHGHDIGKQK